MRRLATSLAVALTLALLPTPRGALAADPTFAELVAAYDEAHKAKVTDEQVRLLGLIAKHAASAVAAPGDAAAQKAIEEDRKTARKVLRRALQDPYRVVILAALDGYGVLALPGSAVDLRPYANRQASERRPHEVRLAAVAAWGMIHDVGTHPLLLDYVRLPRREQERIELAQAALRALAQYRHVPRGPRRYDLLDETISAFIMVRDSATGLGGVSVEATEWYASLRGPMLATWSQLTGQTFSSLTAAQEWWRDNRRAVQAGHL